VAKAKRAIYAHRLDMMSRQLYKVVNSEGTAVGALIWRTTGGFMNLGQWQLVHLQTQTTLADLGQDFPKAKPKALEIFDKLLAASASPAATPAKATTAKPASQLKLRTDE
jgi:hypothetical protein